MAGPFGHAIRLLALGLAAALTLGAHTAAAVKAVDTSAESDPVGTARYAATIKNYRVFTVVGFIFHNAPGVTCLSREAFRKLESRGEGFVSDSGPDSWPIPSDKMVAFNRALGADPGFQVATRCRAMSDCEMRFQATPDLYTPPGWNWDPRIRTLDRTCLAEPGQLIAVARDGRMDDLKVLLRKPAPQWRRRDERGRSAYDHALIQAAAGRHLDVMRRLWPYIDNLGVARSGAPERPVDSAALAIVRSVRPEEDVVPPLREVLDHGARLEIPTRWRSVSLLSVAIGATRVDGAQRPALMNFLLARGADPNGPGCQAQEGGDGYLSRGIEPLYEVLDDEVAFDRLVRAGARIDGFRCPREGSQADDTITRRAILDLREAAGDVGARRRIAVKLLKMGGRSGYWWGLSERRAPTNLSALSIQVAAAQYDGAREKLLKAYLEKAGAKDEPFSQTLAHWLTCPHGAPVLLDDRAELCAPPSPS